MKELIKKLDSLKKPEIFGDHDYQDVLVWNAAIDIAIAKANGAYEPPKDVKEAIEKEYPTIWANEAKAANLDLDYEDLKEQEFNNAICRQAALFGYSLAMQQQKEEWVSEADKGMLYAIAASSIRYHEDGTGDIDKATFIERLLKDYIIIER